MKSFIITDKQPNAAYNADSVNQSIAAHNRYSRHKIGKREAQLIHALLMGGKHNDKRIEAMAQSAKPNARASGVSVRDKS